MIARRIAEAAFLVFVATVIGLGLADYMAGANTLADWFWGVK